MFIIIHGLLIQNAGRAIDLPFSLQWPWLGIWLLGKGPQNGWELRCVCAYIYVSACVCKYVCVHACVGGMVVLGGPLVPRTVTWARSHLKSGHGNWWGSGLLAPAGLYNGVCIFKSLVTFKDYTTVHTSGLLLLQLRSCRGTTSAFRPWAVRLWNLQR